MQMSCSSNQKSKEGKAHDYARQGNGDAGSINYNYSEMTTLGRPWAVRCLGRQIISWRIERRRPACRLASLAALVMRDGRVYCNVLLLRRLGQDESMESAPAAGENGSRGSWGRENWGSRTELT